MKCNRFKSRIQLLVFCIYSISFVQVSAQNNINIKGTWTNGSSVARISYWADATTAKFSFVDSKIDTLTGNFYAWGLPRICSMSPSACGMPSSTSSRSARPATACAWASTWARSRSSRTSTASAMPSVTGSTAPSGS